MQQNSKDLDILLSRAADSRSKKPASVLDTSILAFEDTRSIIDDGDSVLSSTTFDFDDIIVNSKAYREAMQRKTRTKIALRSLDTLKEGESESSAQSTSNASEDAGNSGESTPTETADGTIRGSNNDTALHETTIANSQSRTIDSTDRTVDGTARTLNLEGDTVTEDNFINIHSLPSRNVQLPTPNFHPRPNSPLAEPPRNDTMPDVATNQARATSFGDFAGDEDWVNTTEDSSQCSTCHQRVKGQYVKAFEAKYHLSCFTCDVSPKTLARSLTH